MKHTLILALAFVCGCAGVGPLPTPLGSSTKVYGRIAVGMQGAFGQSQGTDLPRGKAGRELQAMLDQVKTQIEH